jgi:hypothetical protein
MTKLMKPKGNEDRISILSTMNKVEYLTVVLRDFY